jgi:hypothetical protein
VAELSITTSLGARFGCPVLFRLLLNPTLCSVKPAATGSLPAAADATLCVCWLVSCKCRCMLHPILLFLRLKLAEKSFHRVCTRAAAETMSMGR